MLIHFASSAGLRKPTVAAEIDDRDDTALVSSLRGSKPFMTYFMWKVSRDGGAMPRLSRFLWKGQPENPNTFMVAIEGSDSQTPDFRYTQVGSALRARLQTNVVGSLTSELGPQFSDGTVGSLVEAYRQCARTHAPSYEFLSYDFGDGSPTTFERLILPFRNDNRPISHLLGLVLFDEGFWECPHGGEIP